MGSINIKDMIKVIALILGLQAVSYASTTIADFDIIGETWLLVKGTCLTVNCPPYYTLEKSTDHGSSWTTIYTTSSDTIWISRVDFIDENNGWLQLQNLNDGYVTRTSDGGKTWSPLSEMVDLNLHPPFWVKNAPHKMKFLNKETGFIFTANINRTTDGGITWHVIEFPGYLTYYSILNDSIIYAYAENQTENEESYAHLLKSTDFGSAWDTIGGKTWAEPILFYNENEGYRAMPWLMYHTSNGGVTWDSISWFNQNMTNFYFGDSHTGFMVSNYDTLYRTKDGWNSWNSIIKISRYFKLFIEKDKIIYIQNIDSERDIMQLCYSPDTGTTWYCSYILPAVLDNSDNLTNNPVFNLSQNYPNPFNGLTSIEYNIPRESNISITIYDALGRKIRTLINEVKSAGTYSQNFDAGELTSGIYYYRINAGEYTAVKKMILLK
jgi:hypothetical protein